MSRGGRLLILPLAWLAASAAVAQGVLTLEFSFSNPGARSLGFGGAFVALADDATAAYANPAGLNQLTRPEISLEGRSWTYSTPFVVGGRASGFPTGLGIDTTPGLRWDESTTDFTGLSFLSFVYPRKPWSLALYRHQLAKFSSAFATDGLFAEGSTYLDTDRWLDQPGTTDLDISSWGFSAARRITDSLSLGLGLTYLEINVTIDQPAYLPDNDPREAFFSANSYLPDRSPFRRTTRAEDSAFGLVAGLLWRVTDRWSLGGSFRSSFSATTVWEGRPGPAGTPDNLVDFRLMGDWEFPPVFGLGASYRSPDGRLTASFEWDFVRYSVIFGGNPEVTIRDANEIHLGGEYAFLQNRPVLALRLGVWLDPDHRIRATQGDDLIQAILSPGTDELHYALGFGAAFERFQIDLGADLSKLRDTISLSAIFSF
ncbi:MAG: hypothetical protein WBG00_07715 [Thermoanaerobaculia bacterium]